MATSPEEEGEVGPGRMAYLPLPRDRLLTSQSAVIVEEDWSPEIREERTSSSPNLRLSFPKRKLSYDDRNDSLAVEIRKENEKTEQELQKERKEQVPSRVGPSSRATVLSVAGLFMVGCTLIASGLLVILTQEAIQFRVTAGVFICSGAVMLVACVLLQRKNVVRYVTDLEQDLYFFNLTQNKIWKLMFEDIDVAAMPQKPRRIE